ncbi:hypothetical protein LKO27_04700 [Tessaracoccus sp. OS52]|uniref:hypothetical protein n=1 Tax=Tessaracoccus sp. OS52 TaxID=2886691 RepID=UPI001D10BB05|nr:hypothetical protein [Tessaracoccus sp. OS52]MCC2592717.1 hypothetical protein [Tessaracoccus sp. OS52]
MSFISPRLDKSLLRELEQAAGRSVTVLAHGSGPETTVVAAREILARRHLGEWEIWGWEEVLRGAWRADVSTFTWTITDGRRIEAELDSVGRLPELFRERVQASTVATESHDLTRGTVQIVGRRRLDGSDEITWYASASGGASLADPATAAFVVERTDALKAEWA